MSERLCYVVAANLVILGSWLWYSAHFDAQDGWERVRVMQAEIGAYQDKNAYMQIGNRELGVLVHETKKNPQRMEEIARKRLLMVKPGEIFVMPVEE